MSRKDKCACVYISPSVGSSREGYKLPQHSLFFLGKRLTIPEHTRIHIRHMKFAKAIAAVAAAAASTLASCGGSERGHSLVLSYDNCRTYKLQLMAANIHKADQSFTGLSYGTGIAGRN